MARWTPVVFRRCACASGACPPAIRYEPLGPSRAALHVVVHQRPAHVPAPPLPAPLTASRAMPFLLLGAAAALLLATLERPR